MLSTEPTPYIIYKGVKITRYFSGTWMCQQIIFSNLESAKAHIRWLIDNHKI